MPVNNRSSAGCCRLTLSTKTRTTSAAKYKGMKSQRQTGFTIVELLITLFVASILLAIAVPSYQTLIRNNRLTSQINTFVTSLQYARTEAIRRNAMVSIGAQNAANNANEWGPGWRVWVDTNRNGVEDGGELALKVETALTDNNTLNGPD